LHCLYVALAAEINLEDGTDAASAARTAIPVAEATLREILYHLGG
jgi:hypothetical protein